MYTCTRSFCQFDTLILLVEITDPDECLADPSAHRGDRRVKDVFGGGVNSVRDRVIIGECRRARGWKSGDIDAVEAVGARARYSEWAGRGGSIGRWLGRRMERPANLTVSAPQNLPLRTCERDRTRAVPLSRMRPRWSFAISALSRRTGPRGRDCSKAISAQSSAKRGVAVLEHNGSSGSRRCTAWPMQSGRRGRSAVRRQVRAHALDAGRPGQPRCSLDARLRDSAVLAARDRVPRLEPSITASPVRMTRRYVDRCLAQLRILAGCGRHPRRRRRSRPLAFKDAKTLSIFAMFCRIDIERSVVTGVAGPARVIRPA